ncbi:Hypothetical protein PMT_2386 [Prochlorococcus marinus str. MIT 9313]|uniref:Uncharacterized protein n=1 Tax=Prochlorococcus marinus (strain MIT 9313) TaxID=74547 RepID=B9ER92_PROMM|nr:Hypothetical protein PMT_2386 [Prochlorococcus marinus str. MIT 9313]
MWFYSRYVFASLSPNHFIDRASLVSKKRYQLAFTAFYSLTVIKQACDLSVNHI